jgi:hypothetical protein
MGVRNCEVRAMDAKDLGHCRLCGLERLLAVFDTFRRTFAQQLRLLRAEQLP